MKKRTIFLFAILFLVTLYFLIQNKRATLNSNELDIYRFEQSLFETNKQTIDNDILLWEKRLGSFFESFNFEILRINSKQENYKNELLNFTAHPDMREAYDTLIEKYPNINFLEKEFTIALSKYTHHFPEKKPPTIITYFSGFNFGVVTNDTILAIGLDYFLGKNCSFYKRLNTPEYMRAMNQKRFILPFCFEAIANNEFGQFDSGADFLSQMIFKGKIMYLLDVVLPEMSIADKIRYSNSQLNWCQENEKNIWSFFIEKDLLFSSDIKRFNSYINYAPFAKGMPKDSPGRIAYFVGWKIVNDYMKNNSNSSLQALMQNTNSQEILQQSRYKP